MICRWLTLILLVPVVLANEHCDATQTIHVKSRHYPRKHPPCRYKFRPRTCTCGWSTAIDRRIVNGENAHVVARRYILTAAHCLKHVRLASHIAAIPGTTDLKNPTASKYYKRFMIQRSIPHSQHDIAILVTVENMFWSRGVGPACLMPVGSNQTFEYESVVVVGFGTSKFGGPITNGLRKINLIVTTNEVCQAEYQGLDTILPSQICAYDHSGRHRDSCQFDSGGPVYLIKGRQHLIGIISRGKSCAESAYAMGINTRVTSFLNWMHPQMHNLYCPVEIKSK
ncbi:venom serine protease-like [Drosophila kikkawai]|uniref:Venom serine protease-like n=1 Tax=Drosophila kikkawai TaxID=30033 RepID=A0ABM4GA07_DROKI